MDDRAVVDLVVIGGGTGGLVASRTAASFGARTVLIEGERLGGDCLWTGCVPSKSLIAAASAASRRGPTAAPAGSSDPVDFPAVMRHVHGAIEAIAPADSAESLEADGIEVVLGTARFIGERSLVVGDRTIRFRQAVIATGGMPADPRVDGAELIDVLTSETVWNLTELPARLLVLGGGAIGCELAQAMARLGSAVTLVHRGRRLLPKEEARASAIVHAALEADGVTVLTSHTVTSFAPDATYRRGADRKRSGTATLDDGRALGFDAVLAAAGRVPRTAGLGLDLAGVRLEKDGSVRVDTRLRTSNPRIWAVGDVTPLPRFTHTAGVNGSLAATNAILGLTRSVDTAAVPRVTFTHPEVGSVGLLSTDVAAAGCVLRIIEHSHLDRAIAEGETSGFTQLVVDRRGRIVGVTIVGPRAGETLGEASLAVKNGISTSAIANTTHAYPTFDDAFWNAAVLDVRARLSSGAIGVAVEVLRRVRSWRLR